MSNVDDVEADQDPVGHALSIDIVLTEIILHAVRKTVPSTGLSSILSVSHAWRLAALLEPRVWRHIKLESTSVNWIAVLASDAFDVAQHVRGTGKIPNLANDTLLGNWNWVITKSFYFFQFQFQFRGRNRIRMLRGS